MSTDYETVKGGVAEVSFGPEKDPWCFIIRLDNEDQQYQVCRPYDITVNGRKVTFFEMLPLLTQHRYDVVMRVPIQPSYKSCHEITLTTSQEELPCRSDLKK